MGIGFAKPSFLGSLFPAEFTVQAPNTVRGENGAPENRFSKTNGLSAEQSNSPRKKGRGSVWVKPRFWRGWVAQADASSSAHILESCTGNSSGLENVSILCLKSIVPSLSLSSRQREGARVKVERSPVKGMCVCVQPERNLQCQLKGKKSIWGYT